MTRRNILQSTLTALAATSVIVPASSQKQLHKKAFKVKALRTV